MTFFKYKLAIIPQQNMLLLVDISRYWYQKLGEWKILGYQISVKKSISDITN